jgi:hypothetical protein
MRLLTVPRPSTSSVTTSPGASGGGTRSPRGGSRLEEGGAAASLDQLVDVLAGAEVVQPVAVANRGVADGTLVFVARELHLRPPPIRRRRRWRSPRR